MFNFTVDNCVDNRHAVHQALPTEARVKQHLLGGSFDDQGSKRQSRKLQKTCRVERRWKVRLGSMPFLQMRWCKGMHHWTLERVICTCGTMSISVMQIDHVDTGNSQLVVHYPSNLVREIHQNEHRTEAENTVSLIRCDWRHWELNTYVHEALGLMAVSFRIINHRTLEIPINGPNKLFTLAL